MKPRQPKKKEREKMEHKGIEIEVNNNGMFTADIGESSIEAESLKECKKQIDTILKPKARIKAFYYDRWESGWEEPKTLEVVEVTSRATEPNYFWVVSVEKKARRKVNVQDLLKYNKEDAERIFSLNQTIRKSLDEVEELKEKQRYSNEELLAVLTKGEKPLNNT